MFTFNAEELYIVFIIEAYKIEAVATYVKHNNIKKISKKIFSNNIGKEQEELVLVDSVYNIDSQDFINYIDKAKKEYDNVYLITLLQGSQNILLPKEKRKIKTNNQEIASYFNSYIYVDNNVIEKYKKLLKNKKIDFLFSPFALLLRSVDYQTKYAICYILYTIRSISLVVLKNGKILYSDMVVIDSLINQKISSKQNWIYENIKTFYKHNDSFIDEIIIFQDNALEKQISDFITEELGIDFKIRDYRLFDELFNFSQEIINE